MPGPIMEPFQLPVSRREKARKGDNMKKTHFRNVLIAMALFVIIPMASAFNFGTTVKTGDLNLTEKGGCFGILAWTSDETNVNAMFMAVEKPDGWRIEINPETISINRTSGSEIVMIAGDYARATLIRVCVYPSPDSDGEYTIKLKASASSGSSEMQSTQERFFNLRATANKSMPDGEKINYMDAFILGAAIIILLYMVARRFLK
jgi:hypothetical protein